MDESYTCQLGTCFPKDDGLNGCDIGSRIEICVILIDEATTARLGLGKEAKEVHSGWRDDGGV